MGKKKFKKFSREEILAELAKAQPRTQINLPTPGKKPEIKARIEKEEPRITMPAEKSKPEIAVPDFATNTKRDLKKIGLLFGSMILVLVAINIISIKTNLINSFGDFLFRILHLS